MLMYNGYQVYYNGLHYVCPSLGVRAIDSNALADLLDLKEPGPLTKGFRFDWFMFYFFLFMSVGFIWRIVSL